MNNTTSCKGCRIVDINFCKDLIIESKIKDCPCRICLIKGVCDKSCEEFSQWQKLGIRGV